jgi:hypothetical protein
MTMIIGLNLSDRVYLSADTRVTYGDGRTVDNALKILPLLDRAVHSRNNTIVVAIAGDVAFATFLYLKLDLAFNKKKRLNPDIREFYKESKYFLEEVLKEWVSTGNACEDGDVALIFSGVTNLREKTISVDKLEEMVKLYEQKVIDDRIRNGAEIKKLLQSDPVWKILNEKMQKEAGMTVEENLALSEVPTIPDYITNAINKGSANLEGQPDSLLFGAWLSISNMTVSLETAEWGEALAYGDRISKDSIPKELLVTLEFSGGKQKNQPHMLESAIMTVTVLDTAKEKDINSIGGTVIIVSSTKDGEMIMGKDIIFKEGNTSVRADGGEVPLIPFNQYSKYSQADLKVKM